ncbi:hypothetical protein [Corticibacter populi]|uniref:hypothetical protein n=1 Tax=Corticibacter populi TaxID=1550736 RepID=UPI00102B42F7|nr:hypothetical protein [Corticibacter populi]
MQFTDFLRDSARSFHWKVGCIDGYAGLVFVPQWPIGSAECDAQRAGHQHGAEMLRREVDAGIDQLVAA